MNGSVFSKARYMNVMIGFEILAHTGQPYHIPKVHPPPPPTPPPLPSPTHTRRRVFILPINAQAGRSLCLSTPYTIQKCKLPLLPAQLYSTNLKGALRIWEVKTEPSLNLYLWMCVMLWFVCQVNLGSRLSCTLGNVRKRHTNFQISLCESQVGTFSGPIFPCI